ncbi:unnamed protein product [Rhizoctonia solani]|uniref:Uncharacterized protein n=1 Tax=Rhizoctonia solani TaxID=456999 RepID=A0A8H3B6L9_9AGAM|nr:unnamed protein product [Rhizoctonia solani]
MVVDHPSESCCLENVDEIHNRLYIMRRKCDEGKPHCLRCLAARRSCIYEYVEHSEGNRNRVKRTKPAPTSSGLATAPRELSSHLSNFNLTSSSTPPAAIVLKPTILARPTLLATSGDGPYPNSNLNMPLHSKPHVSSLLVSSASSVRFFHGSDAAGASFASSDIVLPPDVGIPITTGQTSQEFAFYSGEDEAFDTDKCESESDDNDLEGVRVLLCTVPNMDRNVKDNSLPFVLYSYSQWAITRVFEPLRIAHTMQEKIIAQFSSENTRTRTILIANVMDMFARNLVIDGARKFIVDQLVLEGQKCGAYFLATPSLPELDKRNAMRTLDSILEIFTQPLAACLQSLDYAAPVFRRGCSEPPGQPVNIANLLLESNISLQCFAILDIIQSATTGRPTYCQYEVPFSLELCERVYGLQNDHGLQWHLGFPDPFILLFAWINSLSEIPEATNNSSLIAWVETNLPQIKVSIAESGDPLLCLGRTVIQECWRYAVLIYLYMVLCKANAYDPRVVQAQQGFMRLIRGVKPGRNPDAHLSPPAVIAGVVTIKERDRETLQQRILGVQEFTERGTVGNDYMLELEDVWTRTKDEGRPAVWSDLRIACFRVTGR